MARIRTIKPEFFRHEALYELERETNLPLRVAFAGLWTAADREGRFKWVPRQLKLDCLPFDDVDFCHVLDALSSRGFVEKYTCDGKNYGVIPSWKQHQHVNQREAQSTLPDPSSARTCVHVTARGEGKGKEGKGKESASAPVQEVSHETSPPSSVESQNGQSTKYVFECGVIRLIEKDFEGWKKAYQYVDVPAELTGMADWAVKQENWFTACSGLLNKRNREQKTKIETERRGGSVKWRSGIEGVY